MVATSKLPCHYVDFLCKPGLSTNAGRVPLQRYMSLSKGNAETASLFGALRTSGIRDTDSGEAAVDVMPGDEWKIMEKGQGNHAYFIKLWNWMWDNQEQLEASKSDTLKRIYARYFAEGGPRSKPNPLHAMVQDHYFGIECIGFVSNYLRYVGQWPSYLGVNNHQWKMHFADPVNKLGDIQPLDLLEWTTYGHIALVDTVNGIDSKGRLSIELSQSSGFKVGVHGGLNGPMSNTGAFLTPDGVEGHQACFVLSGDVPVAGQLQVRRMRSLVYQSPRHTQSANTHDTRDDSYSRR